MSLSEKCNCYNPFGDSDLCLEIKLNVDNIKAVLGKVTDAVIFSFKKRQ